MGKLARVEVDMLEVVGSHAPDYRDLQAKGVACFEVDALALAGDIREEEAEPLTVVLRSYLGGLQCATHRACVAFGIVVERGGVGHDRCLPE